METAGSFEARSALSLYPTTGKENSESILASSLAGGVARRRSKRRQSAWLIEIAPQGVVDNDGSTVSEGFDRMADTSRYDRDQARPGDLGNTINAQLKLTLDDLIDFFLGMKMLVNGRAALEIVMRKCQAWRVEIASFPAWQALYYTQTANVHKWHRDLLFGAS